MLGKYRAKLFDGIECRRRRIILTMLKWGKRGGTRTKVHKILSLHCLMVVYFVETLKA